MQQITGINPEELKLIERYFDYDLNENESNLFSDRRDSDFSFNQQVILFEEAHKMSIKIFHQEVYEIKKPSKVFSLYEKKWWLGIAAAISLLLTLLPMINATPDLTLAIAMAEKQVQGFNTDELDITVRTTTSYELSPEEITKSAIVDAYKAKKYTHVLHLIEDLPITTDLLLLQAIAYEELDQLGNAKQNYLKVIATKQGQLDIARWGLVEVCLKQEDFETAKNNLLLLSEKVSNDSFKYGSSGQKALEILDLL